MGIRIRHEVDVDATLNGPGPTDTSPVNFPCRITFDAAGLDSGLVRLTLPQPGGVDLTLVFSKEDLHTVAKEFPVGPPPRWQTD